MRQLGDLERVVMERVWTHPDPVSVRDVLHELRPERDLAYTTVMTVMDKLRRKGLLTRKKAGRAFLYRAVMSREEHTASFMGQILAGTADRTAVLMHFLDEVTPDEAARMRDALNGRTDTDGTRS